MLILNSFTLTPPVLGESLPRHNWAEAICNQTALRTIISSLTSQTLKYERLSDSRWIRREMGDAYKKEQVDTLDRWDLAVYIRASVWASKDNDIKYIILLRLLMYNFRSSNRPDMIKMSFFRNTFLDSTIHLQQTVHNRTSDSL